MSQYQNLWIAALLGLLLTIGPVAEAATVDAAFATTPPSAVATDSSPNMLLFTLAGLLAALFCAWRGCERKRPHVAER